jgi:neutral ceramidase
MLRAGVARCTITPPTGMPIVGYAAREGVANGKDGELYATALVLNDKTSQVAILSFDLTFILEPLASILRKEIGGQLGIPPSHVLLNCSHTHGAPPLQRFQYDFDDEDQENLRAGYAAGFAVQMPALAAQAAQNLSAARIGTGVGEARIGINRREPQPDGSIMLGENALGPVDHEVRVIRVDDLEGKPIAVIFAHGCHTVTMGPKSLRWSADYIGPARDLIENNLGCLSLYLQANAGDINPICGIGAGIDDSSAKMRIGLMLGGEVLKVHSSIYTESARGPRNLIGSLAKIPFYPRVPIRDEPDSTIAVEETSLELPLQDLPTQEAAEEILRTCDSQLANQLASNDSVAQLNVARRYRHWANDLVNFIKGRHKPVLDASIQAIRIGELAIVAVPGETFSALGMEVKRRSPFRNTLFVGYSNGCVCYIPTRDAFPKGGWKIQDRYAVPDLIFQAYLVPVGLRPDCGEIVVEKSLDLLRKLKSAATEAAATEASGRKGVL